MSKERLIEAELMINKLFNNDLSSLNSLFQKELIEYDILENVNSINSGKQEINFTKRGYIIISQINLNLFLKEDINCIISYFNKVHLSDKMFYKLLASFVNDFNRY